MPGGRSPSSAALTGAPPGPPSRVLPAYSPPPAQPFRCLQPGFLWIAVADSTALLSTTFHQSASLTGWSNHLAPGCTCLSYICSWRSGGDCFHVFRVALTCAPTRTQPIDSAASGSTLTPAKTAQRSRSPGHFRNFPWSGSPWLAHGSPLHGDLFPNPTGLLLGAFCRPFYPAMFRLQPPDASFPFALSCPWPIPHVPFHDLLSVFLPRRPPATLWRGPEGQFCAQ